MLSYDVVDVFTDRPFAGNPLAVVHGTEGMSGEQLLAIAREFNLSETTFPEPPGDGAGREYAVRIFTPGGEIPFAGHPTLGTAWVLQQHGVLAGGTVVQHCGAGDIEVRLPAGADDAVRLAATPRDLAGPVDAAPLAELVGLSAEDVVGDVLVAGCGLNWVHLPVHRDALERCRSRPGLAELVGSDLVVQDPVAGVYVHAVSDDGDGDGVAVRARAFCPDLGIVEDPATGSAAVGLGIALVARDILGSGGAYTIAQGVEMGRPSTLHGHVQAEDGRATLCEVGGGVSSVASGTLAVPG